jgi:hypothetical protein
MALKTTLTLTAFSSVKEALPNPRLETEEQPDTQNCRVFYVGERRK